MGENPYQSPLTPGAEYERVPQRGNPYSWPAIAYLFGTIAFTWMVPAFLATHMRSDRLAIAAGVLGAVFVASGLFALWKSWRPQPEEIWRSHKRAGPGLRVELLLFGDGVASYRMDLRRRSGIELALRLLAQSL